MHGRDMETVLFYTTTEAARILRVSNQTIRNYIYSINIDEISVFGPRGSTKKFIKDTIYIFMKIIQLQRGVSITHYYPYHSVSISSIIFYLFNKKLCQNMAGEQKQNRKYN